MNNAYNVFSISWLCLGQKKHLRALLIHYDRIGLGALRNVNFVSILSKKKKWKQLLTNEIRKCFPLDIFWRSYFQLVSFFQITETWFWYWFFSLCKPTCFLIDSTGSSVATTTMFTNIIFYAHRTILSHKTGLFDDASKDILIES